MYEQHGDTGTRLYRIWKSMKCRCLNANHPSYIRYGGRGITIYPLWQESYSAFKSWAILNGYGETLELDRIDVNGDYEPHNCRWISHHEQTLNRRDTLYVISGSSKFKMRDFAQLVGLSINTINAWRHDDILEQKLSERMGYPVIIVGGKKGGGHV